MQLTKYENLTKGTIINSKDVEKMVGVDKENAKYSLRVMALCKSIESYFSIEWGESVTVVQKDYEVVVLTDEDASKYSSNKFVHHLSKLGQHYRKMQQIDINNLEMNQKDTHIRNLNVMGATYLAATQALKKTMSAQFPVHKTNKPQIEESKTVING